MSHIVEVKAEIRDLEALEKAAVECGMVLDRQAHTFRWYGRFMGDAPVPAGFTPADYGKAEAGVLKVKTATAHTYEVGVVRRRDGGQGYALLYDNWCGGHGLEAAAGKGLSKLLVAYNRTVIALQAKMQGKMVLGSTVRADGWTSVRVSA